MKEKILEITDKYPFAEVKINKFRTELQIRNSRTKIDYKIVVMKDKVIFRGNCDVILNNDLMFIVNTIKGIYDAN